MTTTLLWLAACGPALIGLLSRRMWATALLIALNAAVVALIVWMPDVALLALLALYGLAVALVMHAGRPSVDPVVERELLAKVRRISKYRLPTADWG